MKLTKAFYRTVLPKILRETADILEQGGQPCNLTEDELEDIWDGVNNQPISKEVACAEVLECSRSTFDARVAEGIYPPGRHTRNGRGKFWYKNDLIRAERRRLKKLER
mgnify:CR=1 FL=1